MEKLTNEHLVGFAISEERLRTLRDFIVSSGVWRDQEYTDFWSVVVAVWVGWLIESTERVIGVEPADEGHGRAWTPNDIHILIRRDVEEVAAVVAALEAEFPS